MSFTLDDLQRVIRSAIYGLRSGVIAGIVGFAETAIILTMAPYYPLPSFSIGIFLAFNLLVSITIISRYEEWGSGYLIGWLFGQWLLVPGGIIEVWLVIFYTVVGMIFLVPPLRTGIKGYFERFF